MTIDAILVPQGAEYKAVCRGLKGVTTPPIFPTPAGVLPITRYLTAWQQEGHLTSSHSKVLLMGLCGSLSPSLAVGDVVLYESCLYSEESVGEAVCDVGLNNWVSGVLRDRVKKVKGLTSAQVLASATEKQHFGKLYDADAVDMEGYPAWKVLRESGVSMAMLRVVSDDSSHDIPNLTAAYDANGSLQMLPLTLGLLRQPIAAKRLISGAMEGLKVLQEVTEMLFKGR